MGERLNEEAKEDVEEIKEKKDKKKSFLSNIPIPYLIGGFIIVILVFINANKNSGTTWFILIGIGILLYFISLQGVGSHNIIDPIQARSLIEDELLKYRRRGVIKTNEVVEVGMCAGKQFVDGAPMHYNFSIKKVNPDTGFTFMRAQVDCRYGHVLFQKSLGEITGRETRDVINAIPKWFKESEKIDKTVSKLSKGFR